MDIRPYPPSWLDRLTERVGRVRGPASLLYAAAGLLAIALIDLRTFRIPDWLSLPLIVAGLARTGLLDPERLPAHVLGAAAGYATLGLLGAAYFRWRGRDGLGLGDAKLFAGLGALLGLYHGIEAEFFSLCAASIFALARLAWHPADARQHPATPYIIHVAEGVDHRQCGDHQSGRGISPIGCRAVKSATAFSSANRLSSGRDCFDAHAPMRLPRGRLA